MGNFEDRDIDISKIDIDAGRRAFLKSSGLMAAGVATLGLSATPQEAAAQDSAFQADGALSPAAVIATDATVLNFALNLEYLEAEFYLRAAVGRGLTSADTTGQGVPGGVLGGRKVTFATPLIAGYAREIANDEERHVKFLRFALGGAAVARPAINLATSFTAAARAAGLITASQNFDAFANETNFLLAAYIFEDVGVTAYKGAARLIVNKDVLEAAAGILAVEAYHSGEIRSILASRGLYAPAQAISNARDSLDGATDLDQGIGTAGQPNIVPTNGYGIAFSRTPQQVLNIVYLGANASPSSFFPRRLNGAIR
jgi:hypothetical protein